MERRITELQKLKIGKKTDLNPKDIKILRYLENVGVGYKTPKQINLWETHKELKMKKEQVRYGIKKLIEHGKLERFTFYKTDEKGRIRKQSSYRLLT